MKEKFEEKFISSDHHHSITQKSYSDGDQSITNADKNNKASSSSSSQKFQLTNETTPLYNFPHQSNRIISLKDYFIAPDRPKSIDNCFLSPTPLSSVKKFRLFDEIEKISHNLFKITVPGSTSNIQQQAVNNDNIENTGNCGTVENLPKEQMMNEKNFVNSTANNPNRQNMDENNNKNVDTTYWKTYDDEEGLKNKCFAEILNRLTSTNLKHESVSPIVHWPVSNRRTKYKINQMSSRDVPIVKDKKTPKLQKQDAVDSSDEQTDKYSSIQSEKIDDSQFNQKFFIYNSNSIDCGQLNSFRSIFELHASTGQTVKKIQASFETKNINK